MTSLAGLNVDLLVLHDRTILDLTLRGVRRTQYATIEQSNIKHVARSRPLSKHTCCRQDWNRPKRSSHPKSAQSTRLSIQHSRFDSCNAWGVQTGAYSLAEGRAKGPSVVALSTASSRHRMLSSRCDLSSAFRFCLPTIPMPTGSSCGCKHRGGRRLARRRPGRVPTLGTRSQPLLQTLCA